MLHADYNSVFIHSTLYIYSLSLSYYKTHKYNSTDLFKAIALRYIFVMYLLIYTNLHTRVIHRSINLTTLYILTLNNSRKNVIRT